MVESAAYLTDAEQLMEGMTSLELKSPETYTATYNINYPPGEEEAECAGDLDWRREGNPFRRSFPASSDDVARRIARANIGTVASRYDVARECVELLSVCVEQRRFIPLD